MYNTFCPKANCSESEYSKPNNLRILCKKHTGRRDMIEKEFDGRVHLGFLLDCVARETRNAVNRGVIETNDGQCNMKYGWLLGFLQRQKDPVFQKDLEKIFHFPKSTLADMIQYLEKSGYIAKVSVDTDARKKQIVVTEKGQKFTELAESQIMAVDDYISQDIPPEHIEILLQVLEKMRENAKNYKSYIELKKED